MRVFEKDCAGGTYRVVFHDWSDCAQSVCVKGREIGSHGAHWSITEMDYGGWREVVDSSPPFDITKLDTAGVFHEEPKPEPVESWPKAFVRMTDPLDVLVFKHKDDRARYRRADSHGTMWTVRYGDIVKSAAYKQCQVPKFDHSLCDATLAVFYMSECDIANATIAELRQLLQRANDRAEFEYKCRVEAAVKKYEHYDNCKTELRDQLTKAWMRNDLTTADRIADLIAEKRPSEHEAADSKADVRA